MIVLLPVSFRTDNLDVPPCSPDGKLNLVPSISEKTLFNDYFSLIAILYWISFGSLLIIGRVGGHESQICDQTKSFCLYSQLRLSEKSLVHK